MKSKKSKKQTKNIKQCNDYEVLNRKTNKCKKCPNGYIKRVSYKTKKNSYVH